jgi:YVTN family beta-propeller protein
MNTITKTFASILFFSLALFLNANVLNAQTVGKTVHINFEKYPGSDGVLGTSDDIPTAAGDSISTQFASVGATFSLTDGGSPQLANPGGVFASFSRTLYPIKVGDGGNTAFQDITITFSTPVTRVKISSLDTDEQVQLRAFDAAGNQIAVGQRSAAGDIAIANMHVIEVFGNGIAKVVVDLTQAATAAAGPEYFDVVEYDLPACSAAAEDLAQTTSIAVGDAPAFSALSPDGTRLYVINRFNDGEPQGSVNVIDTETASVLTTIPLGVGIPFEIKLTPDGRKAYVAVSKTSGTTTTSAGDRVVAIDTLTFATNSIPTGLGTIGLAISSGGGNSGGYRVYVTNRGSATQSVQVINTLNDLIVTSIAHTTQLIGIALTPDDKRAYVAKRTGNGTTGTLSMINTSNNTVVGSPITLSLAQNGNVAWLTITPDGKRAYVGYFGDNRIAVVDTDPPSPTYNTEIGIITTTGTSANYISMTPDGRNIFVLNSAIGKLFIIDTATNTQIGSVNVGSPSGIAARTYPELMIYVTNAAGSISVLADPTPPDTTAALNGATGSNGWYVGDVTVNLSATDASPCGAGVKQISYNIDGEPDVVVNGDSSLFTLTNEGVTNITYQAQDFAGNSEATKSFTVKIDKTAPTTSIASPAMAANYVLNQSILANYSCADSGSGVASCVGTVANGSAIDTSSVGTKTFTVTATDVAGNTATQTVTYTVGYNIVALFDQTKAHNSGSTIPVKLRIVDASGANQSNQSIVLTALRVEPGNLAAASPGNSNLGNVFAFDSSSQSYQYNLKSEKTWAAGTYRLVFSIAGDPVERSVTFVIK